MSVRPPFVSAREGCPGRGRAVLNHVLPRRLDFNSGTHMTIQDNKVVSLNYTLRDDDGNILDRCQDASFVYLHGAGNILPGLERAIAGKQVGDSVNVSLAPEDAYGARDEAKTQSVPREMFDDSVDIEAGMQFHAEGPNGEHLVVTVVEVDEQSVTVDGNHPMAGISLNFEVEVMGIRDASAEELAHGHVHGAGGHHH